MEFDPYLLVKSLINCQINDALFPKRFVQYLSCEYEEIISYLLHPNPIYPATLYPILILPHNILTHPNQNCLLVIRLNDNNSPGPVTMEV